MKEYVKSVVLTVLVVCSLVQTYFLIYRLPGNDPVVKSESDYIKTENMGTELQVEQLLYPEEMIIHLGDNKHTIFYPNSTFYNLIYPKLQGRLFDGFQRYQADHKDWEQIRMENEGVELKFGSGVPVTLLQKLMHITADPLFEGESIDRVFIYSEEEEGKVHVYFFSSKGDVVYEATKADLTVQDVRQHIEFGREWTPYTLVDGGAYYIPEDSIKMAEARFEIGMYTTDQMQHSLFFDPSITRYIREKDGSEIYTDSKRSLQVKQSRNWMNYTDPAAAVVGESNPSKSVLSAIDFVNQHGGWNGSYLMELGNSTEDKQLVTFQQYYDTYPIIETPGFHYAITRLDMRQGTTTGYERSLIYIKEENQDTTLHELPGGNVLRDRIAQIVKNVMITALYPAYQPSLTEDGLLLKPVWVLELANGTIQLVN